MDKSKVALRTETKVVPTCVAVDAKALSSAERIDMLEKQIAQMHRVILQLKKGRRVRISKATEDLNPDGIPVGTVCFGATEKSPFLFYLSVEQDGYAVGGKKYASLSAAAEDVSQVRRSGWTFWRLLDGRTLKEAYKG